MAKLFRKIISIMLVVCMIFTSQAFVTFAEGMENTEAIVKETTIEETTVKETTAEETTVKETEETTVETIVKETIMGENSEDSANNELISPDVDEKEESTETDYAEEPEEDEIETKVETETEVEETTAEAETEETVGASEDSAGAKLGEPETEVETESETETEAEETTADGENEDAAHAVRGDEVGAKLGEPETEVKTESEAETEVEEKLFGDPPIYTLSLDPNFPEGFSLPEGSSWYEDKSGPLNSDTDSILIEGWNTRICVDTAGNVCNLTGYNTKADGSGTSFSYQESIFKEKLEYFDLPSGSYDLVLYAMWRTSKLYTIHYNQNLPEGYSLAEGSTWGSDATLWDYVDDFEFEIYDYTGMTCEDSDGKTLALIKWNTAADGTGDDYSFGDWIYSQSPFTDGELTLYAVWGKEYTLSYNQNLPEGYNLSEGKIWYPDETFPNAESIYTELNGSEDMTCEDANGITRKLLKWNTKADGTGTDYNFADEIADATHFTDYKLILYAVWSEGPYMYWIVDGDDANKTIHYYASAGEGRTAVTIGTDGIEYTSLETSEKEKIKKAVIEEPIVATDVRSYFKDFKGLVSITNLGNLDTSNATSFKSMFEHCEAIEKIETSGLETNSLTDTSYMFTYCTSATDIILDDNFDTSNVTSMREMFNTTGAEELDLTKFDTSNVTDMYGMFSSCENLETIRVSDKFVVEQVTSSNFMFSNCVNLKGEKGTTYGDTTVESKRNKVYAHIDEGSTNPGLFSGASTPTTYTVTYNQNLPSGYTISASKTWYTDSTSDDLSSNPIKILGSAGMTCENADGYVRKLEAWNTLADKTGTPYMFAENISSPAAFTSNPLTLYAVWGDPVIPTPGTDKFYIISYGNPTEYPNEKKIFAFDSTTTVEEMENFVANNISKCINPSGKAANGFYDMSELIPVGADDTQVRQILNDNYDLTKEKIRTLDKIAVWFEDYIPDPMGVYLGITFEGSTPAKTVTKIAIKTNPTKTTYDSGDAFDPTGLVITVAYSDGSTEDVDYATHQSDFSFNPTTITASGDVVVTYGGKTASIAVTISEEPTPETEVSSIKILTNPTKTSYTVGDKLNPAGLRIEVTYSNGDIEEVPYNDGTKDKFSFIPSLSANLNIAHKSIKITYGKKSTSFNITVSPKYNPQPYNPGDGGSSSGSSSDPTHGPMGDLTKNPAYQNLFNGQINQNLNNVNAIPQNKLINNTTLINTLKAYPENANAAKTNAKDINGNTGFGQWQRVPGTTTWYFLSGDLNSNGTTGTVGFLSNGWYNLGWDGQDKWYHFDANGVMQLGWYQENEKIYYLQNDFTDNWYGKAVTGQQMIDGITYTFDSNGALIR